MSGPRSLKRKRVMSRRQIPGQRGPQWMLLLECGHEVWRTESGRGGVMTHADCWKCEHAATG